MGDKVKGTNYGNSKMTRSEVEDIYDEAYGPSVKQVRKSVAERVAEKKANGTS